MADAALTNTIRTGDQRNAPKIQRNFEDLRDVLNGLTDDNVAGAGFTSAAFADALAVLLGLTKGGTVRRGKTNIATEESRTNTAYGLLSTPDRVQGVTVPADGLLFVGYQAMWKNSSAAQGAAAIHIGSNILQIAQGGQAAPVDTAASGASTVDSYGALHSRPAGLIAQSASVAYTGDETTGQVLGGIGSAPAFTDGAGFCVIQGLPAGAVDVSIQFKAGVGSVTAKNRKLYVWSMGF